MELNLTNNDCRNKDKKSEDKKSEDKKAEDKGSMIAKLKSKKEMSLAEILMKQKECVQKRISTLQKRISFLDNIIEKIPYMEMTVMDENGLEKLVKIYTEEDQALLNDLK